MGFSTTSTLIFLLSIVVAGAVVHRFPAKHLSRSKHQNDLHKRNNVALGPQGLRAHRANLERSPINSRFQEDLDAQPSAGRFPVTYGDRLLLADITIGTPAQTLTVEIDPYHDAVLGVIGSAADLRLVTTKVPKKTYNSSASSTYTAVPGNFSDYGGRGHWGNDVVNLGGINVNLTFGIDDKLNSFYDEEPIDGILGLSPRGDTANGQNSVLQQLLYPTSQVDIPVVTIWTNLTSDWNDSAQVTLGSNDPEHCDAASWTFGTEIQSDYKVNVTSATAKMNGSDLAVDLGTRTVNLAAYSSYFYVPKILEKLMIAASNATFSDRYYLYEVKDCDVSKIPSIRLDVVGASKPLVLIPTDFVAYWTYYDLCYLNLASFDDHDEKYNIYLPYQFNHNHCIAYNFRDKTVGIGLSKSVLQSPTDF